MKKKRMFYLVATLALLAVSVVVFFFITRVAIPDYTYSKIDRVKGGGNLLKSEVDLVKKGGSLSKSDVDWINGGGSLPHSDIDWTKPDPEHYQGGSGNNEGNGSGYSGQPKPYGTPYSGHPHVVWTGDGRLIPDDGYDWENPKKPGANNYRVVPLPLGTPYSGHPHVVWTGDGLIKPADGYNWENPNKPSASNYRVVPLTTREKIQEILPGALRASKDKGIRDWIVNNVECKPSPRPSDRELLSPWAGDGYLIFTERFLTETKATRENLIAFESGKLFFTIMKDKPVKDGKTLETWFADFSGRHNSMIWNMREAKSKDQNEDLLMIGDFDKESQFGYIFRVQALQLDKPKDKKARQEWDEAIHEFQKYINPLLRGR